MTKAGPLGWNAAIAFCLVAIAIPTGGLLVAPAAGLAGLIALAGLAATRPRVSLDAAWLAAGAFVLWAAVTWLWSPHAEPANVAKFVLGVALYGLFVFSCAQLDGRGRALALSGVVFAAVSGSVVLALELATGGALTIASRGLDVDIGQVWRNLGSGASILTLLAPVALVALWDGGPIARAAGLAVVVVVIACGLGFGITSNVTGLVAGLAGALAAAWRPRATVAAIGAIAAGCVLFAPVFGLAAAALPTAAIDAMPLSWAVRAVCWRELMPVIAQSPIFGHGFDASRTIEIMAPVQNQVFDVVRLHPHNTGLQIWVETGLAGAALAAVAIGFLTRRIVRAPGLTDRQARAAAGGMAAYVAMSLVSYGAWQEWWIATGFMIAAGVILISPPRTAAV